MSNNEKSALKRLNPLISWWMAPGLPIEHIFIKPGKRPKRTEKVIRVYVRKWLIHPIKRRLAKYYLLLLQKIFGIKVVAITGSAGKTSTKEMIASVLSQKGKTISSYKNIDPVYNIPSTILRCTPDTKFLVLEMAVEFKKEMDFYLWLVNPEVGVMTNIFPTHTKYFGDEEGVYNEKVKLIKSLPGEGAAVLYSENKFVKKAAKSTKAKVIFYGNKGDVKAEKVRIKENMTTKYILVYDKDKKDVHLPAIGKQFLNNSLAAAAVGYCYGLTASSIAKGLSSFKKPAHRMDVKNHKLGALIIDDSYNNNPEAAKEAIRVLLKIGKGKKKIIVFGDMLELGRLEKKYHRQLGSFISKKGIDCLIGVGNASKITVSEYKKKRKKKNCALWAEDKNEAYKLLVPLLKKNTVVLIKGSRSIGLEVVVDNLFS